MEFAVVGLVMPYLCQIVPTPPQSSPRRIQVAVLALVLLGGCAVESAPDLGPDAHVVDASVREDPDAQLPLNDAAVVRDATVAADATPTADAALSCLPYTQGNELVVLDSQGPAWLIGGGAFNGTQELSGTVTQQGMGLPADALSSAGQRPERPDEFRFLRILAGTRSWTIGVRNLKSFGLRDGAEVSARLQYSVGAFSPTEAVLTLRSAGKLAFVLALGGPVANLSMPAELAVEEGSATCMASGECGSWAVYTLKARDTETGAQVELQPNEQKPLGAFQVIHGGDSQQLPDPAHGCPDWYVSRAQLTAYRSEPLGGTASACRTSQSSSLAGVRIEFPADVKCSFSLAEAAAGIALPYAVVVDNAVSGVARENTAVTSCSPSERPADLYTFEELSGNQQRYARLDLGNCGGEREAPPITLAAGRFAHTFKWDGFNWSGPSDTSQPKGPFFPAGVYTLRLRAAGKRGGPNGGVSQSFEVLSTLEITLTP